MSNGQENEVAGPEEFLSELNAMGQLSEQVIGRAVIEFSKENQNIPAGVLAQALINQGMMMLVCVAVEDRTECENVVSLFQHMTANTERSIQANYDMVAKMRDKESEAAPQC